MRLFTVSASAVLAMLSVAPSARACEGGVAACPGPRIAFPAYTTEGLRIGTVEAPSRRLPRLERSRSTGQPLTVVFNNPESVPGAVDPEVTLVRLPRVARSTTQAVYPRGY